MPNQLVTLYPALNGPELVTELRQLIVSGHTIVNFSRCSTAAWHTFDDMALDLNPPIYDWLVVYSLPESLVSCVAAADKSQFIAAGARYLDEFIQNIQE